MAIYVLEKVVDVGEKPFKKPSLENSFISQLSFFIVIDKESLGSGVVGRITHFLDQCQVNSRQFLVRLVEILTVLLHRDGFAESREALVDKSGW